MIRKTKPKLAIIGLTDCEGCQLEFFGLKDRFPLIWQKFEIVSWRLLQNKRNEDNIDILLIEGTPVTREERAEIKRLRKKAALVGSLGSCADLGGINAILTAKERQKAFKRIYQKNRPIKREVKPLEEYIDLDFKIPGCPIDPNNLAEILANLLINRIPQPKPYPVCFECKLRGNDCLLLKDIPCLGPITAGGCSAICPSQGHPCFGCYGQIKGVQIKQMKQLLLKRVGKKETQRALKLFLHNQIKR